MATIEQVKDLIRSQLAPINYKVEELFKTVAELSDFAKFIDKKYDDLLEQVHSSNSKIDKHNKDLTTLKRDIGAVDKRAIEAGIEVEELAQYIRRDCLEISGIKPNESTCTPEAIVESVSQAVGVTVGSDDIAIAHPLPSTNSTPKIIVKFTRRKVRNMIYEKRKGLMKKRAKDLHNLQLRSDAKVYISESLTPKRKKLFGEINKEKKRLGWKFIWTQNEARHSKEKRFTRNKYRHSRGTGKSRPKRPLVYGQYSSSTTHQINQDMFLTHGATQSVTQETVQTVYNGASLDFDTIAMTQTESMEPVGIQHNVAQKLAHFPFEAFVNTQWSNQMGSYMGNTTDGQAGFVESNLLPGVPPNLPWISSQINRVFVDNEPSYGSEGVEPTGMSCSTDRLTPYSNVQSSAKEDRTNYSNQIFEDHVSQETNAYNTSNLLNDLNEILQQSMWAECTCLSNSNGCNVHLLKMQDIQDCMLPTVNNFTCNVL